MDLSSPGGTNDNEGINLVEFSLHYITLDQIVQLVSHVGKGAVMAKFDVAFACRNVPVHPCYRYLLVMKWPNQYYVDLALPFGLRSAPFILHAGVDPGVLTPDPCLAAS